MSSDIQTLADIEDGTVATNAISNVGNIASDVTAVANDATDIGTVATDLTGSDNIGTVATNIANVNLTGGSIANVNTVGSNIGTVNEFGERYRVEASAPTTSLDIGDLYFDTSTSILNVYGSSGWQNAGSSVNGTSQRYNYTATNAQTTFTGADNGGNTLAYDAGYIDVYLNGVKLLNGTDVTVTSGTSVVLASGATTGDVVDIVAYGTFSVASLNADNLDSGTVPDARITGAYTGITSATINAGNVADSTPLIIKGGETDLSPLPQTVGMLFGYSGASGYNKTGLINEFETSAGLSALHIVNNSTANSSDATKSDKRITIDYNGDISFYEDTGTTAKMLWDASAERLGIGTSSPATTLHVSSGTANTVSLIESTDAYAWLSVKDNSSANSYINSIGASGDNLQIISKDITFRTASAPNVSTGTYGTERMRIDSSGNVLVGKTSTGVNNLGIEARPIGLFAVARDSANAGYFTRRTNDGNILQLYKDTTMVGNIGGYSNDLYLGTTDTGLKFNDFGDYITPFNPSTLSERDNAIGLGTTTSRFTDLYLSGGAYLGGTGSANKLDDYEEGTWTPTDLSGAGLTFASSTGQYVKIGKMVYLGGNINYPGNGSSADMLIGGLPFTCANIGAADQYGIAVVSTNVGTNHQFRILRNSTQIIPRTNTNTVIANSVYGAKFFQFFGHYQTT